ncbi:MAG: methyl-accepting chemotaxis protein [Sphingomonas adhaesiva]
MTMIRWFKAHAPIRRKFDTMTIVYATLAAIPLAATVATYAGVLTGVVPVAIAGAAFALTVAFALATKKAVCDPYVTTVVRMEALARGDLAAPVLFTDHHDCVGRMTKAMSIFRENAVKVAAAGEAQQTVVAALGTALGRVADRDLSFRIETPFPPDYEQLRVDYHRAMDSVGSALDNVSNVSSGINSGASDIRQASDELSQRTEQQAASLEETAAAMDEITSIVRESAAGAARADEAVGDARREAERSGEVVRRAVAAMDGIERSSNEISEIISVIDGIAFQTNLLALNAGVEAARAGDAGKGFAVVASEVRALAQRSADAAKDVKVKIMASSSQVQTGVEMVSEAGKALERIISRIAEISTLVSTIAISAQQQAGSLQQVNTAVSEMDGVTQQNAAMVEQATAAARSLADEADSLAVEVARFQMRGASARAATVVHELQARAASAGRAIARSHQARRVAGGGGGSAAVAVSTDAQDDWTEF